MLDKYYFIICQFAKIIMQFLFKKMVQPCGHPPHRPED